MCCSSSKRSPSESRRHKFESHYYKCGISDVGLLKKKIKENKTGDRTLANQYKYTAKFLEGGYENEVVRSDR